MHSIQASSFLAFFSFLAIHPNTIATMQSYQYATMTHN
jgi:hypothetical protein